MLTCRKTRGHESCFTDEEPTIIENFKQSAAYEALVCLILIFFMRAALKSTPFYLPFGHFGEI